MVAATSDRAPPTAHRGANLGPICLWVPRNRRPGAHNSPKPGRKKKRKKLKVTNYSNQPHLSFAFASLAQI